MDGPASGGGVNAGIKAAVEDRLLRKLDPEFLRYFSLQQSRLQAATQDVPIQNIRDNPGAYQPPCALDTSGYPGVSDYKCPSPDGTDIPVRVYYPDASAHGPGPYPAHINFHGKSRLHDALCHDWM